MAANSTATKIIDINQTAAPLYAFATQNEANQFQFLTHAMRCLVCQNEPLADSEATLAEDFRKQIALQIKQHKTNAEIIQYFTTRYGNSVLYNPPLNVETIFLWVLPAVFFYCSNGHFMAQFCAPKAA